MFEEGQRSAQQCAELVRAVTRGAAELDRLVEVQPRQVVFTAGQRVGTCEVVQDRTQHGTSARVAPDAQDLADPMIAAIVIGRLREPQRAPARDVLPDRLENEVSRLSTSEASVLTMFELDEGLGDEPVEDSSDVSRRADHLDGIEVSSTGEHGAMGSTRRTLRRCPSPPVVTRVERPEAAVRSSVDG